MVCVCVYGWGGRGLGVCQAWRPCWKREHERGVLSPTVVLRSRQVSATGLLSQREGGQAWGQRRGRHAPAYQHLIITQPEKAL